MIFLLFLSLTPYVQAGQTTLNEITMAEYELPILQKMQLLNESCLDKNLRNIFVDAINDERQKIILFLKKSAFNEMEKKTRRTKFDKFVYDKRKEFESKYPAYRDRCRAKSMGAKELNPILQEFKEFPREKGIKLQLEK